MKTDQIIKKLIEKTRLLFPEGDEGCEYVSLNVEFTKGRTLRTNSEYRTYLSPGFKDFHKELPQGKLFKAPTLKKLFDAINNEIDSIKSNTQLELDETE